MARRRARKRPAPRRSSPWGRLLWIPIVALGVFSGWLWYRAAFGPGNEAGTGADPGLAEASEPAGPPVPVPNLPVPAEPVLVIGPGTAAGTGVVVSVPVPQLPPELADPTRGRTNVAGGIAPPVFNLPSNPAAPATVVGPEPAAGGRETALRMSTEKMVAMQLALARRGISSGSIDGVAGSQTRSALRVFQRAEGLPVTGEPDPATLRRLGAESPAYTHFTVTAEDLARLRAVPKTWMEKASQPALEYENVLEMVAERTRSHPRLIRALNPEVDWRQVPAGKVLRVPAVETPAPKNRAAFVRISLSEKTLRAFDAGSNLLAHFPCSIASKVEKRPLGTLKVVRLAPNPNYRFDPDIFPESPEARKIRRKLMIPPGPNNPVGTAWIGLDRPGYGIHGTPNPEDVGRTESHGCFRLSNWNAEHLLRLAWVGMPVHVEP